MRKIGILVIYLISAKVILCHTPFKFKEFAPHNYYFTSSSRDYPVCNNDSSLHPKTYRLPSDIFFFDVWRYLSTELFESLNVSTNCRREYEKHRKNAVEGKLNSLKLFDATGKPHSGILKGNVNQYGDFDECLEVPNAQYCLTLLDLAPWWPAPLTQYADLIHSHFAITETFKDPSHRVSGSTFVRWGFCVPKECTPLDLKNALAARMNIKAKISENMCQTRAKLKPVSNSDYLARGYFIGIFVLVAISSIVQSKMGNSEGHLWSDIFTSFAIQKNFKQLISVTANNKDFSSVHGVRFLSALALLMAHKTMAAQYNPYINKTWMAEMQAMEWSVIGRNSVLYTDNFLLISGLLNANALIADMEKYNRIQFGKKLANRLVRILPGMVTIILFCTFILPSLGSGPLWPVVIDHHANLCKKNMWRNIFFVHNYFGFKEMCLTHTHQLGIDMQLFLVTPLILYIFFKNRKVGLGVMFCISGLSTLLRFRNTVVHKLSYVVHFGISISRLFDTADFSYILPTNRASIYLLGVTLAVLLRNPKKLPLSKRDRFYIWTFAYTIGFITWFAPVKMSVKTYEYDPLEAGVYSAVYPFTWGIAIGWIIYAAETGIGGWFAPLLTWKYFQIFTKIAYGVYLVQFPVFFYSVGIRRHAEEYKSFMMLPSLETGFILAFATCLALFVEMPCHNLYRAIVHHRFR